MRGSTQRGAAARVQHGSKVATLGCWRVREGQPRGVPATGVHCSREHKGNAGKDRLAGYVGLPASWPRPPPDIIAPGGNGRPSPTRSLTASDKFLTSCQAFQLGPALPWCGGFCAHCLPAIVARQLANLPPLPHCHRHGRGDAPRHLTIQLQGCGMAPCLSPGVPSAEPPLPCPLQAGWLETLRLALWVLRPLSLCPHWCVASRIRTLPGPRGTAQHWGRGRQSQGHVAAPWALLCRAGWCPHPTHPPIPHIHPHIQPSPGACVLQKSPVWVYRGPERLRRNVGDVTWVLEGCFPLQNAQVLHGPRGLAPVESPAFSPLSSYLPK